MIHKRIEKIEEAIRQKHSIKDENKIHLLRLLGKVKPELTEFHKSRADDAIAIVDSMERATHEAMRPEKNPMLHRLSIESLNASVSGLELSHPRLVDGINYVATFLANMGI